MADDLLTLDEWGMLEGAVHAAMAGAYGWPAGWLDTGRVERLRAEAVAGVLVGLALRQGQGMARYREALPAAHEAQRAVVRREGEPDLAPLGDDPRHVRAMTAAARVVEDALAAAGHEIAMSHLAEYRTEGRRG